jgi:hypothetical protein
MWQQSWVRLNSSKQGGMKIHDKQTKLLVLVVLEEI